MEEKNVVKSENSPAAMIRMAVEGKADLDKLEKLLALQKDWETNEARKVYALDFAEARRICLNTIRNNRVRYAKYGYKDYPDYLSFLQSRYCPTKGKLSKAEQRLNGNWLNNLRKQLAKGE